MVKVTVSPFCLFIEAEVSHETVHVGQQTMQLGDDEHHSNSHKEGEKEKKEPEKVSDNKVSKMIEEEMEKVAKKKIERTGLIMHGRGLSGKVGAGIHISCGIISVEIEISIQLSSVVLNTLPLNGAPSGDDHKKLQQEEVPISKQMFDKFDKDKSGSISYKEFEELCYDLGHKLSKEEAQVAVAKLDQDGSKSISYAEFKQWWENEDKFKNLHFGENEQEVMTRAIKYFRKYDKDGRGSRDKKEFKSGHKRLVADKLTSKDLETVFSELDSDRSETISFNEYVEWLMNAQ